LNLPIFQVDAFTARVLTGNPAAVCPLEKWLADEVLQGIAAENNLSETAFFVPEGGDYGLRWFTPQFEVDLCGHATLATGFVLLTILAPQLPVVRFNTRSGQLAVKREGDLISMDFPSLPPWKCGNPPRELVDGLSGGNASSNRDVMYQPRIFQTKNNYFVIYEDEDQVRNMSPDFERLKQLHPFGVCVTAPGNDSDFVSRYFVPSYGIPEDPVTGSTHSSLIPYWSKVRQKQKFYARQVSKRGGEVWCELHGERVILKGNAVLYLTGTISL